MGVALRHQAARLEAGHNRGSDAPSETQPRVPIIGLDSGCIPGTKPGCAVRALEATERDLRIAGKELVRRKLRAARGRS